MQPRTLAFFPAHEPRCPRCGYALPGQHPHWGTSFATCVVKRRGQRCGQPSMIVAAGQVCAVIALTHEELGALRRDSRPADEILRELHMLGVAMVPVTARAA